MYCVLLEIVLSGGTFILSSIVFAPQKDDSTVRHQWNIRLTYLSADKTEEENNWLLPRSVNK